MTLVVFRRINGSERGLRGSDGCDHCAGDIMWPLACTARSHAPAMDSPDPGDMDISVKVPPPLQAIFHEQAKSIIAIRVSDREL